MGRGRKLVHGVGINDADYVLTENLNGKQIHMCPFYRAWRSMLHRCYDGSYQKLYPSYRDASVCEEWLIFSNFKKWMEEQDWEGKQLDKDLLFDGNKTYSPTTCIFITAKVNSFILENTRSQGLYKLGVHLNKRNKFISQISNPFTNKREYLGSFTDELSAHLAWKKRKHELACMLAESEHCNDPRLAEALRKRYL